MYSIVYVIVSEELVSSPPPVSEFLEFIICHYDIYKLATPASATRLANRKFFALGALRAPFVSHFILLVVSLCITPCLVDVK